jgi:hypothetical protein
VKKQPGSKKLTLSKETLTQMAQVHGGSRVWDTVYRYPAVSSNCTGGACGIA